MLHCFSLHIILKMRPFSFCKLMYFNVTTENWKCLAFHKTSNALFEDKGRWQRWEKVANITCLCFDLSPFLFMCSNFSCQGQGGWVVDIGLRLERLQPPSRWLLPLQYAWTTRKGNKRILFVGRTPVVYPMDFCSLFRCHVWDPCGSSITLESLSKRARDGQILNTMCSTHWVVFWG